MKFSGSGVWSYVLSLDSRSGALLGQQPNHRLVPTIIKPATVITSKETDFHARGGLGSGELVSFSRYHVVPIYLNGCFKCAAPEELACDGNSIRHISQPRESLLQDKQQ
jgi:hypothetical protein